MTAEAALEWVGAVGIIGAVAAITYAVNRWVSGISLATDEASKLLDQFISATNVLLDDERTPLPVAEFIVRFSSEIASPKLADWFIDHHPNFSPKPRTSEFAKAMDDLPSELSGAFSASVLGGLLLSAASSPSRAAERRERVQKALEAVARSNASRLSQAKGARAAHQNVIDEPTTTAMLSGAQRVPPQMKRAVVEYVEMQPFPMARRREPVAA